MIKITKKAFDYMKYEISCYPQKETGGLFLGYYHNSVWNILETVLPGPNAIHDRASFSCDKEYVDYEVNKIANIYDEPLHVLGLWHSHINSSPFSIQDIMTNQMFAELNDFGSISLLVDIEVRKCSFYIINPNGEFHLENDIFLINDELKEIQFDLF